MSFSWPRFVALVFCTLALSFTEANALPRLQLHPVELVGYKGNDLRIRVELPCGSTYYGIVARVARKGTLEVAAAVAQDTVLCTLLPRPEEVLVDYLATAGFEVISPMKIEPSRTRLQVAKIQDLRISGREQHKTKLVAVYEPRCGQVIGSLIRQPVAGRLEVAIAELPQPMVVGSCTASPRSRTVLALDVKPRVRVAALRDKPESLSRAFELRFADVRRESVRTIRDGLSITYKRACNEAPVAVVVGNHKPGMVEVGMLVAHYYNYPCDAAPSSRWEEYVETGLSLPTSSPLTLIRGGQYPTALTLAAPLKVARRGVELEVGHLSSCAGDVFVAYGRDRGGLLSVGVLTLNTDVVIAGASSCKLGVGKVSLSQPFIAKSVKQGELAAMRLKGSATR